MNTEIRRVLIEALIIFAIGVVLGLSFNAQLVIDAFAGRLTSATPAVVPAAGPGDSGSLSSSVGALPAPVALDEVRELLGGAALAVDARAAEIYAEGHLPGAISLPLGEQDARLPEFMAGTPRETTLIVYCSGFGCPDSFDLGERLLAEGYGDVRVYEGGFPEWRDAGLPVETEAP